SRYRLPSVGRRPGGDGRSLSGRVGPLGAQGAGHTGRTDQRQLPEFRAGAPPAARRRYILISRGSSGRRQALVPPAGSCSLTTDHVATDLPRHAYFTQELPRKLLPTRATWRQSRIRKTRSFARGCLWRLGSSLDLKRTHNPKVAGSNPAPATT